MLKYNAVCAIGTKSVRIKEIHFHPQRFKLPKSVTVSCKGDVAVT